MLAAVLGVLAIGYVIGSYIFMVFYFQCIYKRDGWDSDYTNAAIGVLLAPVSVIVLAGCYVCCWLMSMLEKFGKRILGD